MHGHAADQQAQAPVASPPTQAVASPASDTIPVAEIATQAATTTALLQGLASRFAPSAEIETIQRSLGWPVHVASFLVLVGVIRAARRRVPQWTSAEQDVLSATLDLRGRAVDPRLGGRGNLVGLDNTTGFLFFAACLNWTF